MTPFNYIYICYTRFWPMCLLSYCTSSSVIPQIILNTCTLPTLQFFVKKSFSRIIHLSIIFRPYKNMVITGNTIQVQQTEQPWVLTMKYCVTMDVFKGRRGWTNGFI